MRTLPSGVAAIGLALLLAAGPTGDVDGQEPPVYGSQLMTEHERAEYRARMRAASSEQEREQMRQEHHVRMQERAEEQGVRLPEEPPAPALRRGAGGGQGHSADAPGMRRQGSGAGRRGN